MRDYAVGRYGADWILPLDADEFVILLEDEALVPGRASQDKPLALPWRTYVPDESDEVLEQNPALRIRSRLAREARQHIKVMVPNKLAALPGAALVHGCHHSRRCQIAQRN